MKNSSHTAAAILAAVAICGCVQAVAADEGRWRFVGVGSKGVVISVDATTLSSDGGIVTAWVQYAYDQDGPLIDYRRATKTLQREEINCRQMVSSVAAYATYDKDGAVLRQGSSIAPSFTPIIPDSAGEAVWRVLCSP